MKIPRRDFLKSAGTAALAAATTENPLFAEPFNERMNDSRKLRVIVYWEQGFPAAEGCPVSRELLDAALSDCEVSFLGASDAAAPLSAGACDALINPFGSAFPKRNFEQFSNYLREGGNWVNIGGMPLSLPVSREGMEWRTEQRQTAFHKKIGITQMFPVAGKAVASWSPNGAIEETDGLENAFTAAEIYELYARFTVTKDFPHEDGSAGARDAILRPLLWGLDAEKRKIAAPFILIDRMQGDFAGGRWALANFRGTIGAKAIRLLVEWAAAGAMELVTRPSFACFREAERPSFTIQFRRPKGEVEKMEAERCEIRIMNPEGKQVESRQVQLSGYGTLATGYHTLAGKGALAPGLYRAETRLHASHPATGAHVAMRHETGFWMRDERLLEQGKSLVAGADYLERDNKTYPVTGTTYMTSDVHRKFLFEPNPLLWDADFAAMKEAGVNMIRTGIWTGWKSAMLDPGAVEEPVLRALDAFLLTAHKYDIPVIFTFFAFLPESWGGVNAYLDPRSRSAQKEFILSFVHRCRNAPGVVWDLINEPSFCNPKYLWQCRPNYDRFEQGAWEAWLRRRYGALQGWNARLQEMYRCLPGEETNLPPLEEFADANIFNDSRPIRVIDYRLFAQECFAGWAREMAETIRKNGRAGQLVTVGQDEGGTYEGPSPLLHAGALDFTCLHNWWMNDSLLWDNLVTKAPGKPNLVEETGVMFNEKMDGSAWRSEEEARDLLERKLAVSFAGRGAGFIEWIWNTNPYMMSDNEAAIGLHRIDGTAKPELEPLRRFAAFYAARSGGMTGLAEPECAMVIPHSLMFSTRNFATESTRRAVRAMHAHCRSAMSAISEHRIGELRTRPKLLLLPAPRILTQSAWEALLALVEQGSTLLVTGPVDADEHWLPVPRIGALGVDHRIRPVAQEEFLAIDGSTYRLSYRDNKIQRVEKGVETGTGTSGGDSSIPSIRILPCSKGRILWSPLPVELAESIDPLAALYRFALVQAGVAPTFTAEPPDPSILILPLHYEKMSIYTFISENDKETGVKVVDARSGKVLEVVVPAGRTVVREV